MLLKEITPHNLGPFAFPQKLRIEPDITVLTGPNDAGKSCYLRLIQLMCGNGKPGTANQRDVNSDYLMGNSKPWEQDSEIKITATFTATAQTKTHVPRLPLEPGDQFALEIQLAPQAKRLAIRKIHRKATDKTERVDHQKITMPRVVILPVQGEIGDVIRWPSPNPAEKGFLDFAFQGKSDHAQVQNLQRPMVCQLMSRASRSINSALSNLLPPKLPMSIDLGAYAEKQEELSIAFLDEFYGHVPISMRGSGVRKLINIIGPLLSVESMTEHVLVLFDEPENSLHPDAQRVLRSVLERTASRPNVQVIYATHSPSMINNMRPESIRLVTRTSKDGKATSIVSNRPIGENFLTVRISLGMSPADSLLFASLTVVVEGKTEVLCLPFLLRHLAKSQVAGFEDVDELLAQTHFLDGEGDNYENFCRLAKSQNVDVVIFLDGDKAQRVDRSTLKETHPEVEFVVIAGGKELEELVPRDKYFEALIGHSAIDGTSCTPQAFDAWCTEKSLPGTLTFTRRLENWLFDKFGIGYVDKPGIMKKAIELTEATAINAEPLRSLLSLMSRFLESKPTTEPTLPLGIPSDSPSEGPGLPPESGSKPTGGLTIRAGEYVKTPNAGDGVATYSNADFRCYPKQGFIVGVIEAENAADEPDRITQVSLMIPESGRRFVLESYPVPSQGLEIPIDNKSRRPLEWLKLPLSVEPRQSVKMAICLVVPAGIMEGPLLPALAEVETLRSGILHFPVQVRLEQ